jgi:hypothetical protein
MRSNVCVEIYFACYLHILRNTVCYGDLLFCSETYFYLLTEQIVPSEKLQTYIREAPGSNFGWDTGYPELHHL